MKISTFLALVIGTSWFCPATSRSKWMSHEDNVAELGAEDVGNDDETFNDPAVDRSMKEDKGGLTFAKLGKELRERQKEFVEKAKEVGKKIVKAATKIKKKADKICKDVTKSAHPVLRSACRLFNFLGDEEMDEEIRTKILQSFKDLSESDFTTIHDNESEAN